MRKTRRGAAFYVETLLLVLFLLFCLTVLVRMLGAARQLSREARQLSRAVQIAQNAAEQLAASASREDWARRLGAREEADGTLTVGCDAQGVPAADGTEEIYRLSCRLDAEPRERGVMLTAHLSVLCGQEIIYELDTQKYLGG